jgi:cytochrome c oxidase subunit IV
MSDAMNSNSQRAIQRDAGHGHVHGHVHGGGGGHAHAAAADAAFDPLDPHGANAGHSHGHVIVSPLIMKLVLGLLLMFTVMTVGAAQLEVLIMNTFDVEFPRWVNILVALSIATVKSALVLLYFMQLRYDNPINGIIFILCIVAFAIFLFFSMADLGSRGLVYKYQFGEIKQGGMGMARESNAVNWLGLDATGAAVQGNIVDFERQRYITKVGEEKFRKKLEAKHAAHGGAHHADEKVDAANRSRPLTGITPDALAKPADHHGGDSHGSDKH